MVGMTRLGGKTQGSGSGELELLWKMRFLKANLGGEGLWAAGPEKGGCEVLIFTE